MDDKLKKLKEKLGEVYDLRNASALLWWDQTTYMPPEGAASRGRQLSTLERLAHEKFTDAVVGDLLEDLRTYEEDSSYDSDEASLIRVTRRQYEREVRKPPEFVAEFVAEFSAHSSAAYNAWREARPENDFAAMRPYLEKTLDLSRQHSSFFPGLRTHRRPANCGVRLWNDGVLRACRVL